MQQVLNAVQREGSGDISIGGRTLGIRWEVGVEMGAPLEGIKVIEMAGMGPCPFAGMVLADLGAEVWRVDRLSSVPTTYEVEERQRQDPFGRGKRSLAIDLKDEEAAEVVMRMAAGADILIEGFRPKVMERLGLGPRELMARNPRLIYGRMTGFGQDGPWSAMAGHDIDYIALSGMLASIGPKAGPSIPLNLVGDFGGGAMVLIFGILAAMVARNTTGLGQVIDASMVEGTTLLGTMIYGLYASGEWVDQRESNLLDGGVPFYSVYETSDGGHLAVGALEPQFYKQLIELMSLSDDLALADQYNSASWPGMRDRFTQKFAESTLEHWTKLFEGTDACVAPVLGLAQAPLHAHNQARGTFISVEGVLQPRPSPRFSSSPDVETIVGGVSGRESVEILESVGYSRADVDQLVERGVVYQYGG